jgi:hypothetical protein
MNGAAEPAPGQPMPLDVRLAVICCLMSHYAQAPDPELAAVVREHLERLAEHPECPSAVADAGGRLAPVWQRLAALPKAAGEKRDDGVAIVH